MKRSALFLTLFLSLAGCQHDLEQTDRPCRTRSDCPTGQSCSDAGLCHAATDLGAAADTSPDLPLADGPAGDGPAGDGPAGDGPAGDVALQPDLPPKPDLPLAPDQSTLPDLPPPDQPLAPDLPSAKGTPCDDSDPCTWGDVWDGKGGCKGSPCSQKGGCLVSSTCGGGCTFKFAPTGYVCDDNDACTSGEACDGKGRCSGGAVCQVQPKPKCSSITQITTYAKQGTCKQGKCEYAASTAACDPLTECDAKQKKCVDCKIGGLTTTSKLVASPAKPVAGGMAVDLLGNPHLTYYDTYYKILYYAKSTAGVWTTEVLSKTHSHVGSSTALALDGTGKPRMVFANNGYSLHYAIPGATSWTISEPEPGTKVSGRPAIALDTKDHVHIAYHDSAATTVRYLTNASGKWVSVLVDGPGKGSALDMQLDSNQRPHIAYRDDSKQGLKYAVQQADNSFKLEAAPCTTSSCTNQGQSPSLALDSKDKAHIVSQTNLSTIYATNSGASGWSVSHMASSKGSRALIRVDEKDRVHVLVSGVQASQYKCTNSGTYCRIWITKSSGSTRIGQVMGASLGGLSHCALGGSLTMHCTVAENTKIRHEVYKLKCL